jgi:hypothetical protein
MAKRKPGKVRTLGLPEPSPTKTDSITWCPACGNAMSPPDECSRCGHIISQKNEN